MQEERKRILKLVEEGKLSAEEAFKLLNELETQQEKMEKKQEDILTELSTFVQDDETKKEDESYSYKFQSLKDKIVDFVDSTFKKIRDFDLDFNFGTAQEISHVLQHGDAKIESVDINLANGSVKLVPWDQSDVRIECNAKVYRGTNQDEARAYFLKEILFKVELGTLKFSALAKWMKVDAIVYIPQNDYDKVRIRMFNGPILAENLKSKYLKVKTANGKIAAAGLYGLEMEAETANGKVELKNSSFKELDIETLNGAIILDGDYGRADLKSFNGNINFNLAGVQSEKIEAQTVTGSIDIRIPNGLSVNGELKSNLGGFTVELDGIQIVERKNEVVQKSLYFTPTVVGYQPLRLEAETKTGSIAIKKALTDNHENK